MAIATARRRTVDVAGARLAACAGAIAVTRFARAGDRVAAIEHFEESLEGPDKE